jgi:hypothetical protein
MHTGYGVGHFTILCPTVPYPPNYMALVANTAETVAVTI